ncbi:MAG: hypothetical protein IJH38_00765, partial [Clostridia bacterium]|nr:hypothetical protein [Clostridia bacterium]
MFLRSSNLICELARWEALPAPQAAGAAQERLRGEARLAMSRDLPAMPLSRRLADPAAWRRLQQGRRQALEALMLSEADADAQERILDLVCMIAEESTWSDNPDAAPFDDEQHPVIDFQCAETLMLLGWVRRGLGERLGSRVVAKIQYEARRRVFIPFLAHADYPFMRFALPRSQTGRRPLCILSDILLSAILLEGDPGRRTSVIRSALRLMDQGIRAREDRPLPLADELAETAAVTDLCVLLRKLTRGKVDLTQTYPT